MKDDLINREEVLDVMRGIARDIEDVPEGAFSDEYIQGWQDGVNSAAELIEKIVAAGTVPIKRGRWIKDSSGVIVCSECGEEHEWETYRASYCDTCGAKMSWEEDED